MWNTSSCSPRRVSAAATSFPPRRSKAKRARRRNNRPSNGLLYFLLIVIIFEEVTQVCAGRNFYEVLGVSRDADSTSIKRAFRKLAIKYHPDKNRGDKTAEQMYVELNNAYEVLSDNTKRQKYDMYGEAGLNNDNGGGGGGFDPFGDMFNGFGGQQRQQEERRVPDVVIPLSVTLEMLYNGGVIEASQKRRIICNSWSDCEKTCTKCGGRGIVIQTRRVGPGFVQQIQTHCPVCGGAGKIGIPNCKSCPKGQFEQVEKLLMIDVERGMRDGHNVVFEGHTDELPDHQPGNVMFQIDTQPHSRFQRVADDLHYSLRITLSEALVGVNRIVQQLDGRDVAIKTDKVISPNEEIEIPGEGMPSFHGGEDGKMVVKFWVDFPESLTEEQKKAAIALHGERPSLEESGNGVEGRHTAGGGGDEKSEL